MDKQMTFLAALGLLACAALPANAQSPWETGAYANPSSPQGPQGIQGGEYGVVPDALPFNPEAPSITTTDIPSMTTKDLTPDRAAAAAPRAAPTPTTAVAAGNSSKPALTPISFPGPKTRDANIGAMVDKIFLHRGMQAAQDIIDAAELADGKAGSNSVRRIARGLSSRLVPISQQLAAFATKNDQSESQAYDPLGKRALADLQSSADDFDVKFIAFAQKELSGLAYNFQRETKNGGSSDLKDYATQTAPMIQKEVDELQAASGN